MINFYDPKRSISKLQLALCAGVCQKLRNTCEKPFMLIFRKKSSAKRPVSCK